MKKALTIVIVILVALTVSSLLVGCGADTKQAKQHMKEGEAKLEKLKADTITFVNGLASLSNSSDTTATIDALNKAKTTVAGLSKTSDQARASYEKIKSLNGVPDYVKYADLEIKALDVFQQWIKSIGSYFDQFLSMLKAGDLSGLQNAAKASSDTINKLGQEYSKVDKEAQQLKSDKKL
jgi:hypothetical protein